MNIVKTVECVWLRALVRLRSLLWKKFIFTCLQNLWRLESSMRRMCIDTYSVSFSVKHVDSKATEQVNNTELAENISYRQKSLFLVKPETILLLRCWALPMTLHLSMTVGSGFLGRSFQMKWKWVILCFHITLAFILLLHPLVCL